MKVLILTNQLLRTCGVSKHLYELLTEFNCYKELEILIITGGGNVLDKFRKLGNEVIVNEDFKHEERSIVGFIRASFWLFKFILIRKISIIHSHHHYAANIAQVTKCFFKTKTILTNHGILPEIGLLNHFPSDHIIAVNRHVVEYLRQKYSNKNKVITLISYGIKNRSNENRIRNQTLKFISASRIVEDKGIDTFIKAVSLLPEEIKSKTEFLIAGEGDYLPELVKHESKIQSGVKFIGVIEDLQLFMNQTDIFVMTSVSSTEGFPTTLIEAGYARNLIITSDFRGLKDVFEDNKDGLIFEAGNFKALSEKLILVIQNFETYKNLTENFYRKSLELFDPEVCAKKTYELYKSISK